MMKQLFPIAFYIATLGYIISLVLYGLTFNDVDAQQLALYWPLTIGMMAIWLMAILKLKASEELKALKKEGGFKLMAFLKTAFKGTPVWMSVIAGISFIFAIVNIHMLMSSSPGVPAIIDGEYVMQNHGSILQKLTEQEYKHELAIKARMSMGHFLAFFGVGTAILWPDKNGEINL